VSPRVLYLVRHGRAEAAAAGQADADRRLTDSGRTELARSVQALVRLGVRPDRVLTSPLVRARQTAEILHESLAESQPLIDVEGLASGVSADDMAKAIEASFGRATSVLVVGHMPDLADLVSWLSRAYASFEPGAVALLELDDTMAKGEARLVWCLSPAALEAIAHGGPLPSV
jgi:phosphohistidine phosphatase